MILAELEDAYREACAEASLPVVIVSMQIPEGDIHVLKSRLEAADLSLSEFVRHLIGLKVRELS